MASKNFVHFNLAVNYVKCCDKDLARQHATQKYPTKLITFYIF